MASLSGMLFVLSIASLLLQHSLITASFTGQLEFLPNRSELFCNDGSLAGFYFQKAQNPSFASRFLFFLEGGAWCWDEPTCNERYQSSQSLMSSKTWSSTFTRGDGIFVSADWDQANVAYVPYCSSDAYIGNRTSSADTYGWYFNGKNIVLEIVNQLLVSYNMKQATDILITGCSAGGRGILHNLDFLADYIRPQVSKSANIKGFFDSAWWIEDFPSYPGTNPTDLVTQTKANFQLAGSIPNSACASVYDGDNWQCMFGANLWRFIKTENAYALFETDEYQLTTTAPGVFPWVNNPSMTDSMTLYALQFSNITKFTLHPGLESGRNMFASACYSHCSTESGNWFNVKINGTNLDQAVSNWFFRGVPFQLVDRCQSWRCGVGCPS